jgi:hypothetical protein
VTIVESSAQWRIVHVEIIPGAAMSLAEVR